MIHFDVNQTLGKKHLMVKNSTIQFAWFSQEEK